MTVCRNEFKRSEGIKIFVPAGSKIFEKRLETTFPVENLLKWWCSRKNDFLRKYPWRLENDPYKVLLAEFLLQRTRRDVVVKIYQHLITKYPRPEDLANADLAELMRLLEPLGLRKRVRYLLATVSELVNIKNKKPDYETLRKLPGVGDYIASAVCIFALNQRRPLIDKNVARIIIRFYGIMPKKPERPQDDPTIRTIIKKIMPETEFKEFNLALLDLAWELCKPRKPRCENCPIKAECKYFHELSQKD